MRLLVIGHLCIDCVHGGGEQEAGQWGGIANAIVALAPLAGNNDSVIPVCSVGKADHERFLAWLGGFPAVETSGVFPFEGSTNRIHRSVRGDGVHVACAETIAPPLPLERIRKFLIADGILINMWSGADITLDTLDQIRMELRGKETPVHFDFHNLTMGIDGRNERFRRPLAEWRRWAFMIPTVQLNEEEAAGITVDRLSEAQLVGHLLTLGTRGVILTRGKRGATLFTNEHKKVVRHDVAGLPAGEAPGATGLGDIFGAAFLYRYAATSDLAASVEFANQTAGSAAGRS